MANKLIYASLGGSESRTEVVAKASVTVIPANSFIGITSGLAVNGVAASTALAYTIEGAPAGVTTVTVLANKDAVIAMTSSANFAVTNKATAYDMTDAQLLNFAAISTTVLKVLPNADAGTVGSTSEVRVQIAKSIF